MKVDGKIFYHIHIENDHSDLWQIGKTVETIQEKRNYFTKLRFANLDEMGYIVKRGKPYLINNLKLFKEARTLSYGMYAMRKNDLQNSFEDLFDPLLDKAEELQDILITYIRFVQEIIFENERQTQFPELPSRRTCIWLCNKQSLLRWYNKLYQKKGLRIFQVRAFGEIHKTDGSWITVDVYTFDELFERANKYWRGRINHRKEESLIEYLFTGRLEILKEVNI